ncbi:cysteine synthase A [Zhongshania aliphaticivorans]|uniref:cysteine synthase A n=1 Tax=Zhongshania aliphaticivorans TaxID=1470434 RepID=UPI0012E6CAF9|nr:cysteine synthase A [Zhongshania aliphaticivorans]CAA0108193.1 Cysteine synthase A [Zhongshania aliphaticivorans]
MSAPFDDLSLSIGNTPLIKINRISQHNIFVKMESRNPANSVKCRIGANMIWQAEQDGKLNAGMEIVEPTSGNTGIALAFVAAARGYPITLTMPNTMSMERRKVLLALGAKLILSDGSKGMKGAIAAAEAVVESDPARYFMPQQFSNPANPAIHERTTGPEIWRDTNGGIDILISGVGTGGTLSGISRYIKSTCGKAITTVAVEPNSSTLIRSALNGSEPRHAPHKIQGIGAGFLPDNLDLSMVDTAEAVSDEEAMQWAHRLMKEEGILAGISSGAAMAVAERVASLPENTGKTIVAILPDSAERYLSSALFEGAFTEIEG